MTLLAGGGSGGDRCESQLMMALLQVQRGGIVQLFEFLHRDGGPGRVHAQVFRFGLLRLVGLDVGDLGGGRSDGSPEVHGSGGMVMPGFSCAEVQGKGEAGEFLVEEDRGFQLHREVGVFGTAGFLVALGHGRADGGRWRAGDVALVVVPVVFPAVPRVAFITVKWPLTVVAEHVSFQLVGIAELLLAHFTLVGFFPGVHPEMPPEVGDLDELTIAVGTGVGFLAGV